jgi:hypothetical protein
VQRAYSERSERANKSEAIMRSDMERSDMSGDRSEAT